MDPRTAMRQAARYDAHPLYWHRLLNGQFGPQAVGCEQAWYEWDPDTIRDAVQTVCGQALSEASEWTIQALLCCIKSTAPWESARCMGLCAIGLADGVPDPEEALPVPTPAQLILAARAMRAIDDRPFSPSVLNFQAMTLMHQGVVCVAPSEGVLAGADAVLARTADGAIRAQALALIGRGGPFEDDDDPGAVAAARWTCARRAADALDGACLWHPEMLDLPVTV